MLLNSEWAKKRTVSGQENTPVTASTENQADLETNQQALEEEHPFHCDPCDSVFKTRDGLKNHIRKSHKNHNSPEKLGQTSSQLHIDQ